MPIVRSSATSRERQTAVRAGPRPAPLLQSRATRTLVGQLQRSRGMEAEAASLSTPPETRAKAPPPALATDARPVPSRTQPVVLPARLVVPMARSLTSVAAASQNLHKGSQQDSHV